MQLRESEWAEVSAAKFLGLLAACILLAMFFANSHEDFLPILDHVNLAFHEAGHLFFGVFGFWIGFLGGTLAQLLMPIIVAFAFWRKGETASFAVALVWFFENIVNIARYVADARAQQLPLVGGGEHDWFNLLLHWGLLDHDVAIAANLRAFAWAGIFGTAGWLGWRCLKY